ncbi:hypothetical protein [Micromonospora sp. NBC_01796]|uniref:hypothetical protein n=1 Tax=Micromonospora sp. NBC_01796 TaxID=2975987 RepID=UPI002DD955D0|nr:hypothetical protein [Micromonospora sp. NBC_01796]WSA83831.1 hypothetical protein OIE47_26120 [Micromonospora sp. NBC_01796]
MTLTATACGSAASPEPEPELGSILEVRTASDIVTPLDAYEPTPEQQRTIIEAHQLLVQKCAQRFSFDVNMPESVSTPDVKHARLFGIVNAEEAASHGYRVPGMEAPPGATGPSNTKSATGGWNPSDDEFIVVRGVDRYTGQSKTGKKINSVPVPDGGCAGEAMRQLGEGGSATAPDLMELPSRLSSGAHQSAEKDSRVVAAFGAWSACMKEAGYEFSNPWEPNDKNWGRQVTSEEIATATADVECRQSTRLVEIWLAVEVAYQNREMENHAADLSAAKNSFETRLKNAAKILAGA